MENIFKNSKENIERASQIIKDGGVVAIPTDTLYGLSANAFDAEAIEKIYQIKRRPHDKPMIILISKISDIKGLAVYDERLEKLAKKFWPGPLTILLNRNPNDHKLDGACAGSNKVTFRMPDCKIDLDIIKKAGCPIVSTTANISGQDNPQSAPEVWAQLKDSVEFILDDGRSPQTQPSTIIDLTTPDYWRLLRAGVITEQQIRDVI
ncbi:MAG: threonylcarbamoyl-AMP synthase [Lactobacillus sp.]|jgi:L-threonylcarbamoyladenylate synthase|nr:threonylcarbamoyl-AMP synthase [Lactobacillus sp.]